MLWQCSVNTMHFGSVCFIALFNKLESKIVVMDLLSELTQVADLFLIF